MKRKPGPKTTYSTACIRGTLSLPADWWEALKAEAKRRECSVSAAARQLLADVLKPANRNKKPIYLSAGEAHELHNIVAMRMSDMIEYHYIGEVRRTRSILRKICELTGLPNDYEDEGVNPQS